MNAAPRTLTWAPESLVAGIRGRRSHTTRRFGHPIATITWVTPFACALDSKTAAVHPWRVTCRVTRSAIMIETYLDGRRLHGLAVAQDGVGSARASRGRRARPESANPGALVADDKPRRIRDASDCRDEAAPAEAALRDGRAPTRPGDPGTRRRQAHARHGSSGIRQDGCRPRVARDRSGSRHLGDARGRRQRPCAVLDLRGHGGRTRAQRPWPRCAAPAEDSRAFRRERGDRADERHRDVRRAAHARARRLPEHHRSRVPRIDRLRTRSLAPGHTADGDDAVRPVAQPRAASRERGARRGSGQRPRPHDRGGTRPARRTGRACSRARRGRGATRANGGLAGSPLPRVALASRRRESARSGARVRRRSSIRRRLPEPRGPQVAR